MAKPRKPRWIVLGIICGSRKGEKQGHGRSDKDKIKEEGGGGGTGGSVRGLGGGCSPRVNDMSAAMGELSPSVSSRDSSGMAASGSGGDVRRRRFSGSNGFGALEEFGDLNSAFAEVHLLVHPTLEELNQKMDAVRPNLVYCFAELSSPTKRDLGTLSFSDGKMISADMFTGLFQHSLPEVVFLDACSSMKHGEAIRGKGVPHVVCWQSNAVGLIPAHQFSRAFFASLRSHAVGAWDAFCVAESSYKLNCRPCMGEKATFMVSNGVSGGNQKSHGGGVLPQPCILGDPAPRPAVPHVPSVMEASTDRRVKELASAVVLSPEVEGVRVLLCGDSALLDHVRLTSLAEGLDALLTMEARGVRLLHRVSVSPPATAASAITLTKGAFTMRCDICTVSGGRISLVMSGTAAAFVEEQLLEYAIRRELVERTSCVRVAVPSKDGILNRVSNSAASARRSAVVAAGGPVVEVIMSAPGWAVQLLRLLAQESSFRGLVAMGVAGIGGTPVAAFQKEDASRFTGLCRFRNGEAQLLESNGTAINCCSTANTGNGFHHGKGNIDGKGSSKCPPSNSWFRGPAPKRVRVAFHGNVACSGSCGELSGGGAGGATGGNDAKPGRGNGGDGAHVRSVSPSQSASETATSSEEDHNLSRSKVPAAVMKAAMRPIPQPGKRAACAAAAVIADAVPVGNNKVAIAVGGRADSPQGASWGSPAAAGSSGRGAVGSGAGISIGGSTRATGGGGTHSVAVSGTTVRISQASAGSSDGGVIGTGGLGSAGMGAGRGGSAHGKPHALGMGPLLRLPLVKQHLCNRRPLHQCSEMEFIQDLVEFLCSRGQGRLIPAGGIGNFPDVILNGSRLDLFSLYREVVSRGGFHVGNGINWKGQVFARMRNHTLTNKMTGVGNTLKKHYETYLLDYELAHEDTVGDFCILCRRGTEGDWVNCGVCGEWAHFECDKRPGLGAFKDYAKRDGRDYICPRCASAGESYTSSKRRGAHWENPVLHGGRVVEVAASGGEQHESRAPHRRSWGGNYNMVAR